MSNQEKEREEKEDASERSRQGRPGRGSDRRIDAASRDLGSGHAGEASSRVGVWRIRGQEMEMGISQKSLLGRMPGQR